MKQVIKRGYLHTSDPINRKIKETIEEYAKTSTYLTASRLNKLIDQSHVQANRNNNAICRGNQQHQ